jgi:Trp operon repressor
MIKFVKENFCLCICTLGAAIVGYLGYHAVRWIINKCSKTEKIDQLAQTILTSLEEKPVSSRNKIVENNLSKQLSEDEQKFVVKKRIAAVKIQAIFRGYCTRAKEFRLSYELFEKAKLYIDDESKLNKPTRSSVGKCRPYLLKEFSIVLKNIGNSQAQTRFQQMLTARGICRRNRYMRLVIPKARVYGKFIIEKMIDIYHGTKEQMILYGTERAKFTEAVEKFTGFRCQCSLKYITGSVEDEYRTFGQTPIGRYDKIALYLEKDIGKIVLTDLDTFSLQRSSWEKKDCYQQCLDVVHLFPHHLDQIISAAKKFDSEAERYRTSLEKEKTHVLERFKLTYEDHLTFLQEKGITFDKPCEIVQVSLLRQEEIKKTIVGFIEQDHVGNPYKNCLGEDPKTAIELFEQSFPDILSITLSFLSEMLKVQREARNEVIKSNTQLLSLRTLIFDASISGYTITQEKIELKLQMIKTKKVCYIEDFSSLMIKRIFRELAKGREIAYYNPLFGDRICSPQCIFC